VARLVTEEDDFEESDDDHSPCGDFIDSKGSDMLYPTEFLAPSSMPFLKTTMENLSPVLRDSLLNCDEEFIEGAAIVLPRAVLYFLVFLFIRYRRCRRKCL